MTAPTETLSSTRLLAALALGLALGVTTAAGSALLLYTGQGFLRTVGLLISVTLAALSAGMWSLEGSERPIRTGARWTALGAALLLGGVFAMVWEQQASLRETTWGGGLAVLLVLALPAYTSGGLLGALGLRDAMPRAGAAVAILSLMGAAIGVMLATAALIPNLEPVTVYVAMAAVLMPAAAREARLAATPGGGAMQDVVAIVTGVGRAGQLGHTIAQRLLENGARVVISGRHDQMAELATQFGPTDRILGVAADLTTREGAEYVVRSTVAAYGRVDALLNVAGGLTVVKPLAETSTAEWRAEIARNAETAFQMCRAALPSLRQTRGAIVNFAAPAGLRGAPQLAAYSAAKAGVIALTHALAIEEKTHGVRCNAIAPGMMDTAQNRAALGDGGRAAAAPNPATTMPEPTTPDAATDVPLVPRADVAAVALFLVSRQAAGVNGETIQVLGDTLA